MKWSKRVAAIGVAACTVLGATAGPALAGDYSIVGNANYGNMTHLDDGDVFRVCDNKADGAGVTGSLWYDPLIGSGYWVTFANGKKYIDDGGDEGCDSSGYNIGNDGDYKMALCWQKLCAESQVESDWFNE
jgi:hypothetical protein